ncbi:hypothetical protein ACFSUK_10265 [Sphingobium scionense]
MASDRMMQAIGTLERAISRLEQNVASLPEAAPMPMASIRRPRWPRCNRWTR